MTLIPSPETTHDKVDLVVKYLRWGWAVVFAVVVAAAWGATTLSEVRGSINTIDAYGSTRLRSHEAEANLKFDRILEQLNRIEGKLAK